MDRRDRVRCLAAEVYLAAVALAGTLLFLAGRFALGEVPPIAVLLLAGPLFLLLFRRRSAIRALLLLLALAVILLVHLAASRAAAGDRGGGEKEAAAANAIAGEALRARADSLAAWAGKIAADREVARILREERERRGRAALFREVGRWGEELSRRPGGEGIALELFREGEEGAIAWWGEIRQMDDGVRRLTARIASDPLYLNLMAGSMIRIDGRRPPLGAVRLIVPIAPNPDLGEPPAGRLSFEEEVGKRVGGRVTYFPPGGGGQVEIRTAGGALLGEVRVDLPSTTERIARLEARGARAFGSLLFFFWVLFLPWRLRERGGVRGDERGPLREFVRRFPIRSLLLLRALLLLFDYPTRLGALAWPAPVSLPSLPGLVRSPADLLLTALTLLAICLILRERVVAEWSRPGARPLFRPHFLFGLLVLITGATAGFGFSVRAIAGSTEATLFGSPNPIGPPAQMMLELSLFLIAAAYLLIVDGGFAFGARFGAPGTTSARRLGLAARVFFGALSAAAVLFLSRLQVRGGLWFLLAPATAFSSGLLVLYLLRGRGWRVWNFLGFVIATAIVTYPHLSAAREGARRVEVVRRAREYAEPEDEAKKALLEETLRFFEKDGPLLEKLSRVPLPPMESEAFVAWVRSGLSRHDYSVEIRILDRQGAVISRFALDMPAESPVRAAFVFRDIRASGEKKIYRGRRRVAGDAVEIYTGAVPLRRDGQLVGAVVVSLPYFFENLEHAAALPTGSYNILGGARRPGERAAARGGPIEVFLYREGEVVRSSSDRFPSETELAASLEDEVTRSGSAWGRLVIGKRRHDAFFTAWRDPAREGILAFAIPVRTWGEHGLALIDLVLTDLFIALLLFVLLLPFLAAILFRLPGGSIRFEPTFQDKLVLAFLVVALLPAFLLGGAGRKMVADRLREAGEAEARSSLRAVRHALEREGLAEAEALAQSTLVRRRVLGIEENEGLVDLELSLKRFAIFSPEGDLILQNGKIGRVSRRALEEVREKGTPLAAFDRSGGLSLVVLAGITLEGLEDRLDGILMLSLPIDEGWTARLGDHVGRDLSFYENGSILSSTRFELYQSGMLSSRLPAAVFAPLELQGEEVRFGRANIAGIPYLVGYGVLRDFDSVPAGTVAVPLLFREEEARRDLERAYAAITYLTFLVLLVVIALAEGMGQRIARPVRELSRGMDRVTSGDLEQTLPVRSSGEIGRLVRAFNRMTGELKRSRDALTERTRYIETILGSVGAGVIAFDVAGNVTNVNPAASKILGVSLGAMRGARLDRVEGGRFAPLHAIAASLEPGADRIHEAETELGRGAGSITLRVVATAVADAEGRDLGRVIVFEDLTALIQSKKLVAWGEMARQVAHEIKNPLTPMKLSVQHLKQAFHDGHEAFGELLDESANLIIEEIGSLQRIAAEFSTFARMPRREVRPEPPASLIAEAVRLYGEGFEGPRIEVDAPDDLPVIRVDREEVRRLLLNLLENAVQATGREGTIRVTAAVEEGPPRNRRGWKVWESSAGRSEPGPMLVVRITDDGPGVPDAARGKLFEPYFSTKTNGTGLGLAICRAIIDDYGGVIAVGSTPGEGTVAVVAFPVGLPL